VIRIRSPFTSTIAWCHATCSPRRIRSFVGARPIVTRAIIEVRKTASPARITNVGT
jgi:hypothetical protein